VAKSRLLVQAKTARLYQGEKVGGNAEMIKAYAVNGSVMVGSMLEDSRLNMAMTDHPT